MNNEMNEQEIALVEEVAITEEQQSEEHTPENGAEYEELKAALLEAKIKLALLLCGAAKEKLDESTKLAYGLCNAGYPPEEAAIKVVEEYPHLKLVFRSIPTFAAQSGGTGDGFAAIRSIFAKH